MNLVMFGYLLHYMQNRLIKIHSPQKFMFTRRQSRIARKISMLTWFFLVLFCPFMTLFTFPIIDISSHLGSRVLFVTGILLLLNSACNPIIYVWRFSKPRYHMKKLFWFWNKEKFSRIDQMYNQETATYEFVLFQNNLLLCESILMLIFVFTNKCHVNLIDWFFLSLNNSNKLCFSEFKKFKF